MFEKNMRIAYLLDFYVDLLDEHDASVMTAYYHDDLSLAEVAADESISRQGVRHIIKKCEEQIVFLEEKLSLAKKHEAMAKTAEDLLAVRDFISSLDNDEAIPYIMKLNEAISSIQNKGV